jgi:Flp pilus assembly protein TadD
MTSQALTTLQQAVAADPDNADLRHLLGAHCAQNGDYEHGQVI